ncbi:MAG: hypothetical protein U9N87_01180, partial [Planctomycetota bacterium]|nr:hypothetical protein [Planctomycetota bacterium]
MAASMAMAAMLMAQPTRAAELEAFGNTVGHLTWELGELRPGQSIRRTVLFAFNDSYEGLVEQVKRSRVEFKTLEQATTAKSSPAENDKANPVPVIWIGNGVTDFGLNAEGAFYWEKQRRQSLACKSGGQLSRFAYSLRYNDGKPRRAGTMVTREQTENLRIVKSVHTSDGKTAAGTVETADGKLRVDIHAASGKGADAAVEFIITNISEKALGKVQLSVYANIEAKHSHENDYSTLDKKIGGLLFLDLAGKGAVAMCGLEAAQSGFAGNWPSQEQLLNATGTARTQWPDYAGLPEMMKQRAKWLIRGSIPHQPSLVKSLPEPPTHDLTPDEAEAALRRDWLFQADGNPTRERTVAEIGWARKLDARLKKNPKARDLSPELAELAKLEKRLESVAAGKTAENIYLDVRRVKRRIMFANPAINFSKVLFIDNPYPAGAEWPHQARHRNGMMAVAGGRLLVLDGLHPGGRLTKLAPQKPSSFWRPDLSYDARRVLFCCKPADEDSFHLYEINIDGSGLRQLTFGKYDDTDPIYLPDGHIIFTTSRSNNYVRCMPYTYSYILARCDADGKNIYLISRNNEPDWCPSLLHDGRVIYSRWEYHDKALWRIQSLWATNPDGTNTMTFWGNQSVWPDHLAEPRAIPGSNRVMFTGLAHHDWFA